MNRDKYLLDDGSGRYRAPRLRRSASEQFDNPEWLDDFHIGKTAGDRSESGARWLAPQASQFQNGFMQGRGVELQSLPRRKIRDINICPTGQRENSKPRCIHLSVSFELRSRMEVAPVIDNDQFSWLSFDDKRVVKQLRIIITARISWLIAKILDRST